MGILSLLVKLGLDTASFEIGAKRAQSVMTGLGRNALSSVKGQLAAAFSVGAISAFVHSVVEAADRIGDLSDQMDLSTDEVQRLDIAAKRSGLNIEKMGQAFLKVGEYRKRAGEGDADALAQLGKMGVSLSDIQSRSLSNEEITEKIYEWYLKTNRTAKDQADIVDVVGIKAEKLVAAFKELHNLGPVKLMSSEDIKSLSEFKDNSQELARQIQIMAAPTLGFWARVMGRRNRLEQDPRVQWYHGTFMSAFTSEFFDDGTGHKEPAITSGDVKANKGMLEANLRDMYEKKHPEYERHVDQSQLSGGSLRSIGGFLYDNFDDKQPLRQIVIFTEKTADAAKRTADLMDQVRRDR